MLRTLCAGIALFFLPASLTASLWEWAGDTHPINPTPVSCGVDVDGTTVILVAVDGKEDPLFCLRVPVNWRERTTIPIGDTGETVHSPLYLAREPVPHGALAGLTPAPDGWFLSYEPETDSADVLVESGSGYVVVGTAELPSEAHWGKRVTAAVLTPATFTVDTVVIVTAFLFFSWLDFEFPWPWKIDSGYDDEDSHDHDDDSDSKVETPSGLITPAHGPS